MNHKIAVIGLVMVLAGSSLFAQEKPEKKRPNIPASRQAQERAIGRAAGEREQLSEEQRKKIREVSEGIREEQKAISEKLREVRRELEQAAQADPLDEALVRDKARILGDLEAEAALLRARYYKQLRGVLPAERVDQLQNRGSTNAPRYRTRLNEIVRRGGNTNSPAPNSAKPSPTRPATPPPQAPEQK